MPGGAMASPLQNRNSYKPPQILKRPAEGGGGGAAAGQYVFFHEVVLSACTCG